MNKIASGGGILTFFIILIVILLVWGFIGGSIAKDIGVTCDMGIGTSLCWKWHTNIVGQIQEGIENTGNAVSDFVNDLG
ncbi:MAG: hypothetical protein U1B79_00835 [Candidatus Pacearchaeota archaeon]|nr:hypothetical protein [Nanoarchaeota archaeon]MDZ4226637.1 hypothetical protein [Candidatus Pacearchaeota archaeon]